MSKSTSWLPVVVAFCLFAPSQVRAQNAEPASPPNTSATSPDEEPKGDVKEAEVDGKKVFSLFVPVESIDAKQVNSAFVYSPSDFSTIIERAKKTATKGKSLVDLTGSCIQTPKWRRGKDGKADKNSVLCFDLDGSSVAVAAYNAAILYDDFNVPTELSSKGGVLKQMTFILNLSAMPSLREDEQTRNARQARDDAASHNLFSKNKVDVPEVGRATYEIAGQADEDEVDLVRVVLSDDAGNNYPCSTGLMRSKELNLWYRSDGSYQMLREDQGLLGSIGSAKGYEKTYFARLPLLDEKVGKIKPSAKKLTLRIITKAGEQTVEYNLRRH